MSSERETRVVLLTTANQRASAELALVLEARSIPVQQEHIGSMWVLSVPIQHGPAAQHELAIYQRENARGAVTTVAPLRSMGSGWPGILVYLAVILIFAVLPRRMSFGLDWLGVGRMDAGRMLAGDWWRPVTALTLHADTAHLLGNAGFGAFFAYSIGRYWGGGFGWLMIIVAGALGNVFNGIASSPDHRSIGASTAVFAALGLLSAFNWRRGFPPQTGFRERMAPVVAGVGLLAFTGTSGANTDIGAHLMGFAVGFGLGLVVARTGIPMASRVQYASGLLVCVLVVGSWLWGLSTGR